VDNNRLQTHASQEDDVLGEGTLQAVVDHGIATVFDDDSLA
jgi:hypothetical protein blon03001994